MKKRVLAFVLAIALVCSLYGCDGKSQKAFEVSKSAYQKIDVAYELTERFSEDIHEAWRMGIYDEDEIQENGISYLTNELNLTEEEFRAGFGCLWSELSVEEWNALTEEEKSEYCDSWNLSALFTDSLFSLCVQTVMSAYAVKGDVAIAQNALDEAKTMMRELSEKYSDYEHYPNLKGYYTTTSSFFTYCQSPTGNFEAMNTTITNYKNEARDYISDLDYIFED